MQRTAFISYKREERDVAASMAEALERSGWTVWWDPKLKAGDRFDDVIEAKIYEVDAVVVLWSKQATRSTYVKDEAGLALTLKKLVPVVIEDDVALPLRFQSLHTLRLTQWMTSPPGPDFISLVQNLSALARPPQLPTENARSGEVLPRAGSSHSPDRSIVRRQRRSRAPAVADHGVLLNFADTSANEPLIVVAVFVALACGFKPYVSSDGPISSSNLDRFVATVSKCRYSIHDVSEIGTDPQHSASLAFELGGALTLSGIKSEQPHSFLIVGDESYGTTKCMRLLDGQDVAVFSNRSQLLVILLSFLVARTNVDTSLEPRMLLRALPSLDAKIARLHSDWSGRPPFTQIVKTAGAEVAPLLAQVRGEA
jgi:hypothetical protein